MAKRFKKRASLEDILQSTSLTLFPDQDGVAVIRIDTVDCEGDSPLHILAHRQDLYACRLLLENGANPNLQGDLGYTPLHYAAMAQNRELADLLMQFGARTDVASEFDETPASIARDRGFRLAR
ncbi:MAG: ankyrin repeat domain-containing protein [Roseibium sp.]|uniref:ankyrin repeat domain-containing protein n=1 Tax=Roseibium sp. TaxID=1936156 RepID=UPI00260182FA|nr:ankyrin repeat domain-containing protein [Roseibium sp.]MCV0424319.1 ankyrin repeat domain-containing protein [Roseibium sp.]